MLGITAAQAITVEWTQMTLPVTTAYDGTTKVAKTSYLDGNINTTFTKVQNQTAGIYVGANGGAIGDNWQTGPTLTVGEKNYYEGDWYNTNDVGQVILAGRNGTGGTSAALVLSVTPNTVIDALKLSFTVDATTNAFNGKTLGYGVGYISNGNYVKTTTGSIVATDSAQAETPTFEPATRITAIEGDKVVIIFNGPAFTPPTDAYSISGIKVEYGTAVPEPTVLALLALGVAGIALKRKVA